MPDALTIGQQHWRSRRVLPPGMDGGQLRGVARELRQRSVFSARLANAEAVKGLADVVDDMLAGKFDLAEARHRLRLKIQSLGHGPEEQPTHSQLNLMLDTNLRMARGYGEMVGGNSEYALREYPAWELERLFDRRVPRGSEASHSDGWELRWKEAGESTGWKGALRIPMMARKDSPIWQALGDGAGGYQDTLGNAYEPFAFNSGFGWRAVPRTEWERLSGEPAPSGPMAGSLGPSREEVEAALEKLGPDFRAGLMADIAEMEDILRP